MGKNKNNKGKKSKKEGKGANQIPHKTREKKTDVQVKNSSPSGVKSPPNECDDYALPSDAIKFGYPSENLCLTLDLAGALREIEKELTDVIEDRYITCDIPKRKTCSMAMKLAKQLEARDTNQTMRIDHIIESIINDDFCEDREEETYESERDFRQDLIKYILLANAQFTKLSIGTILTFVEDLYANGAEVLEYEFGCPVKCASTVFEFYNLPKDHFESFNEASQMKMKKYYIKEVLRYQRDMHSFLNHKKDKLLRGCGNGDAVGKYMGAELEKALRKNRELGIVMKEEYDYIANREDMEIDVFRDRFRSFSLKEKIGTHEQEIKIDRKFADIPAHILKTLSIDRKETRNIEFDMCNFPTAMGTVDHDHSVFPPPTIEQLVDHV